jgi:hypothetical protein
MPESTSVRRVSWHHWAALLVAPTLWGARLLAGWAIAEVACARGWADGARFWTVQTLVTATALAVVAAAGVVAWRAARADTGMDVESERPASFLAVSGVLASLLFGFLILVEGSSVYLVGCG